MAAMNTLRQDAPATGGESFDLQAVAAAVAEMYANGVSTRKVERIAQRMGIDRLSSSQVSRICKRLDAEVAALRAREFDMAMPCPFLDAAYVKCRREGRARSAAVIAAIAVGADGVRRVVGPSVIDTETYAGRLGLCRDLRMRSAGGVKRVTSDAHEGLRRAIAECFPGAAWQRCIVHLERNVCPMLPSKRQRKAAGKVMQAVFAQEDPAMVRTAYHAAIDAISSFSRAAAGLLEDAECDALAYLPFPAEHRRRSRASQWLESCCLTLECNQSIMRCSSKRLIARLATLAPTNRFISRKERFSSTSFSRIMLDTSIDFDNPSSCS